MSDHEQAKDLAGIFLRTMKGSHPDSLRAKAALALANHILVLHKGRVLGCIQKLDMSTLMADQVFPPDISALVPFDEVRLTAGGLA